jgi:hypothetical protein
LTNICVSEQQHTAKQASRSVRYRTERMAVRKVQLTIDRFEEQSANDRSARMPAPDIRTTCRVSKDSVRLRSALGQDDPADDVQRQNDRGDVTAQRQTAGAAAGARRRR